MPGARRVGRKQLDGSGFPLIFTLLKPALRQCRIAGRTPRFRLLHLTRRPRSNGAAAAALAPPITLKADAQPSVTKAIQLETPVSELLRWSVARYDIKWTMATGIRV